MEMGEKDVWKGWSLKSLYKENMEKKSLCRNQELEEVEADRAAVAAAAWIELLCRES